MNAGYKSCEYVLFPDPRISRHCHNPKPAVQVPSTSAAMYNEFKYFLSVNVSVLDIVSQE